MKKRIRLTEGDLHRIVKQSVKKILREMEEDEDGFYILYSPEVGYLNGTYEDLESAKEAFMEYDGEYEDLTVYYAPGGDLSNADEVDIY